MHPAEQAASPVMDLCGIYFDRDCWGAYLQNFAENGPGYLRAFAPTLAMRAGLDPARVVDAARREPNKAVEILQSGEPMDPPVEEHVAQLRYMGVVRQVIHGIPRLLADGTSVNTRMSEVISRHTDVLDLWPGLDLSDPDQAVAELEHCTFELGTRGASIVHWWSGRQPRDPACQRVYARAEELGVALWIHTGTSFASQHAFDFCSWSDIDEIASGHPELTLVAGHGGWPRVLDGVAVAQRHPNVYLDISAHRPRHMAKVGSGWEPLLGYGASVLRDRIVFGSVTWVHTVPLDVLAREVGNLGLGTANTHAWLHDNAQQLLARSGGVPLDGMGMPMDSSKDGRRR